MTSSFEGRIALVSGSAQGQGKAIAGELAARGARVVVADILEEAGRRVAADLGDQAMFVRLDISDPRSWKDAVERVRELFGPTDTLVNNAGIIAITPLAELPPEAYQRMIRVNQVGPFLGMQAVLPGMREVGRGVIINTASLSGHAPLAGVGAYSATKAAILSMTRTAAKEFAPWKIRVNSVSPGAILTPMLLGSPEDQAMFAQSLPLGRLGLPEDVAKLVAFLASDEAEWITGADVVIDGGQIACQ